MVLADTSVWIEHFRQTEPGLADRLIQGHVLMHPFVCGELACGNLHDRAMVMSRLQALPAAIVASNEEALHLLEDQRLWAKGVGWIDVHLLASALLSHCWFWTFDGRLKSVADELGLT